MLICVCYHCSVAQPAGATLHPGSPVSAGGSTRRSKMQCAAWITPQKACQHVWRGQSAEAAHLQPQVRHLIRDALPCSGVQQLDLCRRCVRASVTTHQEQALHLTIRRFAAAAGWLCCGTPRQPATMEMPRPMRLPGASFGCDATAGRAAHLDLAVALGQQPVADPVLWRKVAGAAPGGVLLAQHTLRAVAPMVPASQVPLSSPEPMVSAISGRATCQHVGSSLGCSPEHGDQWLTGWIGGSRSRRVPCHAHATAHLCQVLCQVACEAGCNCSALPGHHGHHSKADAGSCY